MDVFKKPDSIKNKKSIFGNLYLSSQPDEPVSIKASLYVDRAGYVRFLQAKIQITIGAAKHEFTQRFDLAQQGGIVEQINVYLLEYYDAGKINTANVCERVGELVLRRYMEGKIEYNEIEKIINDLMPRKTDAK